MVKLANGLLVAIAARHAKHPGEATALGRAETSLHCLLLSQRNFARLWQRLTNERSNVGPTKIANVVPTLRQRLAYGWVTVAVLAGTGTHETFRRPATDLSLSASPRCVNQP